MFEDLDLKIEEKKKPDLICPIYSVRIPCTVRYSLLCRCN